MASGDFNIIVEYQLLGIWVVLFTAKGSPQNAQASLCRGESPATSLLVLEQTPSITISCV
jgi:hypothetical protein